MASVAFYHGNANFVQGREVGDINVVEKHTFGKGKQRKFNQFYI